MNPCRLPLFVAMALLPFLASCASMYFHNAEPPPSAVSYTLDQWPYRDYWTGIVFNGEKIGFSHLELAPSLDASQYVISSEAALRFRFLTMDKQVNMLAEDHVAPDLSLRRFSYDYNLDGNVMRIQGVVEEGQLTATVTTNNETSSQTLAVTDTLYPSSVIALYPVLHGLEVGREYRYQVYDGETQKIATVTQKVLAYERSDLYDGEAYKIRTSMYGNDVSTWIDVHGLPVLEMSLNGVLIAGQENEVTARRYLTVAALSKQDVLLDFSLVRSVPPLTQPRSVTAMQVTLSGLADFQLPRDDENQSCVRKEDAATCHITPYSMRAPSNIDAATRNTYLAPSTAVPSNSPLISRQAQEIVATDASAEEKIVALVDWIQQHIEKKAVDVFTAIDVLEQRQAECQGHSYLFAALARSLGLPTRLVNGLVYSEQHDGFLYHTWVETWDGNEWQAIDPTFGQVRVDATHIKLVEGESLADLAPMVALIGKITAQIRDVERAAP